MVNVAHDGHDRRTLDDITRVFVGFGHDLRFEFVFFEQDVLVSHFFGDKRSGFLVEQLVDGHHRTQFHHDFDQFARFDAHFLRQFTDGDGFRDTHFTRDGGNGFFEFAAFALVLTRGFAASAAPATAAAARFILATPAAFATAFGFAFATGAAFARLNMEAAFGFFFVVFPLGDVLQGFLALTFELGVFFGGFFFTRFMLAQLRFGVLFRFFGLAYLPLLFLFSE